MTSILFSLALTGCNQDKDVIQLDWELGESFHLAATYKHVNVKATTSAVSLDGDETPNFTESWSDEVVWTYQVVEAGFTPESGDSLRGFVQDDTDETLTVIKATIDADLNLDEEVLEADPVVYMVFREDRDRLAGLVTFVNVDGERQEIAYSASDLSRSYNVLSQSMLTLAPTFLAPYGTRWSDTSLTLENGSLVDSVSGDGYTDVLFEGELGGGLIATRYEDGMPWPSWTVTDHVEAKLLTEDDVSRRRQALPAVAALPEAPADFDYRGALATSTDLSTALVLDDATIAEGWTSYVYDEYKPWAGSWWPQSKGDLVFGYDGRATLSDRIKSDIDPIKTEMDELQKALRDMEQGSSDYDAKLATYKENQQELVEKLLDFYDGIQADLDGGTLRIEGTNLTHDDGWSYALAELSPMDKMALYEHFSGNLQGNNPWYMPAWELLNHYSPAGGSWWGHCNGWAAAAILTDEPREDAGASIDGETVGFTHADLKGLTTESHYSTYSHFYGERYNDEDDDIKDLSPKAFHQLISFYLKEQRIPLVFDTTAGDAVWNYPVEGAQVSVEETTPANAASLVNLNTATAEELDELPGIGETLSARIVEHRETYGPFQAVEDITEVRGIGNGTLEDLQDLVTVDAFQRTYYVVASVYFVTDGVDETHLDGAEPEGFTETWGYTLEADADGTVVGGTWDQEDDHPDFAWVPYNNPVTWGQGSSENPFLSYGSLLEIVDLTRE